MKLLLYVVRLAYPSALAAERTLALQCAKGFDNKTKALALEDSEVRIELTP